MAMPHDLILIIYYYKCLSRQGVLGFWGAKAIRAGVAGDEAKALPIIALTAAAFESDRENALNAGMNGFLSKPINPAELAAELLDKLAD